MVTEPDATPITTPEVETVAMEVFVLLQVPPVVISVRLVVAPVHTVAPPPMDIGAALTVIAAVL